MSFTTRTVTHQFQNGDGTPASGALSAVLTGRMTNGSMTILPTEVSAPLNSAGVVTINLAANDDPATMPTGVGWQLSIRLIGMDVEEYVVTVPSAGSGNLDLGSLLPGAQQVN